MLGATAVFITKYAAETLEGAAKLVWVWSCVDEVECMQPVEKILIRPKVRDVGKKAVIGEVAIDERGNCIGK